MPGDVAVSTTRDAPTEMVLVRHLGVNQDGLESVATLEVCIHIITLNLTAVLIQVRSMWSCSRLVRILLLPSYLINSHKINALLRPNFLAYVVYVLSLLLFSLHYISHHSFYYLTIALFIISCLLTTTPFI